jgi:hypothetical protein
MREMSESGQSGFITRDEDEGHWRVYFQSQLTAPRFDCRQAALRYLCALRIGSAQPEYARAHEGKELRN